MPEPTQTPAEIPAAASWTTRIAMLCEQADAADAAHVAAMDALAGLPFDCTDAEHSTACARLHAAEDAAVLAGTRLANARKGYAANA